VYARVYLIDRFPWGLSGQMRQIRVTTKSTGLQPVNSDFKSGAQTTQRMLELFRELKFSVSHLLRVSFVVLAQVSSKAG